MAQCVKLSEQGGEGAQGIPARRSCDAPKRPSLPPRAYATRLRTPAIFVHFPHRLAAVATVTQALEIAADTEHCPVALVVDDVVDVGSTDAPAGFGALAAEWLTH